MAKSKKSIIEKIEADHPEFIGTEICPDCQGKGWFGTDFNGHICWKCNGDGILEVARWMQQDC